MLIVECYSDVVVDVVVADSVDCHCHSGVDYEIHFEGLIIKNLLLMMIPAVVVVVGLVVGFPLEEEELPLSLERDRRTFVYSSSSSSCSY